MRVILNKKKKKVYGKRENALSFPRHLFTYLIFIYLFNTSARRVTNVVITAHTRNTITTVAKGRFLKKRPQNGGGRGYNTAI